MRKIKSQKYEKLIVATSIIATFTASSAFAKNEGNIVGVNLLRASNINQYQKSGSASANYGKFKDSSTGLGVSYKYAFNFDNVFLAPGVFFDKLGLKAKDQDGDSVSSNYRYGTKLDVGYDITDSFAAYLSTGLANTNYKVDWTSTGEKKTGSKLDTLLALVWLTK